jgi:hypothetical protein
LWGTRKPILLFKKVLEEEDPDIIRLRKLSEKLEENMKKI